MALGNFAMVGSLFVRALPVVLLTVLVFFNAAVWLMATLLSRTRLWLALTFLFVIAAAFLLSSTLDMVRPMLGSNEKTPGDDARLVGTPFEELPDRPKRVPLSRLERTNVVFVLAVSQVVQVLMVALVTAGIFFILGLILLSPPLLAAWTRDGPLRWRDSWDDVPGARLADSDHVVLDRPDVHVPRQHAQSATRNTEHSSSTH